MAGKWWGAAAIMALHTTNALPSLAKSKTPPVTLFLKLQVNLQFLKPFGCNLWMLKPKPNRDGKFDPIAWEGVLLGYTNDYTCYQVLRMDDQKIVPTRQGQFDESIFPRCPALNQSIGALDAAGDSLPLFQSDTVIPFVEINDNAPEIAPSKNSEESQSSSASNHHLPDSEGGKRWVYVQNHTPAQHIEGGVLPQNIIEGKQARQTVCYMSTTTDPKSHFHAMKASDTVKWCEEKLKEVENMHKHNVWVERARTDSDCPITLTWEYCKNLGLDNQVIKYKARICAQGFHQTFGINFESKYAPTGKAALLRLLLSFANNNGLEIHQLDVRSAFLTCPLEDTVTLLPPAGYNCPPNTIFELKKAIYGLKQASLI
jgi:histone deacetylase 1/2